MIDRLSKERHYLFYIAREKETSAEETIKLLLK
jgi:hypothetical protein